LVSNGASKKQRQTIPQDFFLIMGKKSSSSTAGRKKKDITVSSSSDDILSESHTIADSYSIASSGMGALANDGDHDYGAFQSQVGWLCVVCLAR
jgi:hypothetical protein